MPISRRRSCFRVRGAECAERKASSILRLCCGTRPSRSPIHAELASFHLVQDLEMQVSFSAKLSRCGSAGDQPRAPFPKVRAPPLHANTATAATHDPPTSSDSIKIIGAIPGLLPVFGSPAKSPGSHASLGDVGDLPLSYEYSPNAQDEFSPRRRRLSPRAIRP